MPPGTYTITVSSAGFQSYVETEIAVMPKTIRRVDVTLTVGQVTENLTVEASVAALQTDRAEIRSEVTGNTLINLPVPIGRNYQLLMPTLPGGSDAQNGNSFAANPTRSVNFSVNGTPTNINNFSIDGTNSRGAIDATFTLSPEWAPGTAGRARMASLVRRAVINRNPRLIGRGRFNSRHDVAGSWRRLL